MYLPAYVITMFFRHPIIVVVRAELYWVQSRAANIRMKPNMQDNTKWTMNATCRLVFWICSIMPSSFASKSVFSIPVNNIINIIVILNSIFCNA